MTEPVDTIPAHELELPGGIRCMEYSRPELLRLPKRTIPR